MQFVHQDYAQAEEYYLRACTLDPYDHTITANFNDMLQNWQINHMTVSTHFALRKLRPRRKMQNESNRLLSPTVPTQPMFKHEAAAKIQKCYRRFKGKPIFWKFQGVPESLKIAREHEEFHKFTGHDHKLEDINEWEECSDGLGKTYWFNTKTNTSQWDKPQFAQANMKAKKTRV